MLNKACMLVFLQVFMLCGDKESIERRFSQVSLGKVYLRQDIAFVISIQ